MSKITAMPHKGELACVLDRILRWLDANGIGVFWGYEAKDASLPTFAWDVSRDPNWEPFLGLAKQCRVSLVAVDYDLYDRGEIDEQHITDENQEQAKDLFEKLKPHEGEITHIALKWISDSVVYRFVIQADWADDFYKLQELIRDADEEYEEDSGGLTVGEIEQCAKTLAADPRFQAAKNKAQRLYTARKVLPASAVEDEWDLRGIIEQARSLYELEIRPEQDAALGDQIRKLRAEGVKTNEIAHKLGVSVQRVKQLG